MAGANEFSVVAWTKSLRNLAKVSAITIVNHLKGCGKKEIGEKGYKFFTENYIHDVFVREEVRKPQRDIHFLKMVFFFL